MPLSIHASRHSVHSCELMVSVLIVSFIVYFKRIESSEAVVGIESIVLLCLLSAFLAHENNTTRYSKYIPE